MIRKRPSKKGKAKAAPAAKSVAETSQVVVTLKPEAWLDPSRPEVNASAVMEKLLDRIRKKSGLEPERVQLFPNIGAFSISADDRFLGQLQDEPEVLKSSPNLQQESMKIEPVRKRVVAFGRRPARKR